MIPGSPAARAGLRKLMILVSINGISVTGIKHERNKSKNHSSLEFQGIKAGIPSLETVIDPVR